MAELKGDLLWPRPESQPYLGSDVRPLQGLGTDPGAEAESFPHIDDGHSTRPAYAATDDGDLKDDADAVTALCGHVGGAADRTQQAAEH
ncbi:hypothetical protein [Streptomyces sp. SAS_276]|uniref:hypothetical protein n=1 Tax=Streptomyces sp. SAS_276 TaxID=3412745 RepID=UPI00403C8724